MAYDATSMRLIDGGVKGQQLFRYKTTDLISTVVASGYFDDAVDDYNLETGDAIIVTSGASGSAAIDNLVVENNAGTVTVVNGT